MAMENYQTLRASEENFPVTLLGFKNFTPPTGTELLYYGLSMPLVAAGG
jgi:hypothetical protein